MNFWVCVRSAVLLSAALEFSGADEEVDNAKIKRTYKLRNRMPPSGASFERMLQSKEDMGNIWEKASRMARGEIEALRLLSNADMMSMSLSKSDDNAGKHPTRPPVSEPTPAPIPVLEPTPSPISTPMPSANPSSKPQPTPSQEDCSEETSRSEYIFNRLRSITQPEILMDPTTSQGKAYEYLANEDPGITDHCSYSTLEQRYGLTTFFFATSGNNWIDRSGWLGDEQECSWYGIDCDDIDAPGHLTRLLLRK